MNEVAETGQPVVLTRHGKAAAMVVRRPVGKTAQRRLGRFRDTAHIVGDIGRTIFRILAGAMKGRTSPLDTSTGE